jgi:uncharacterized protein YdaU (DUF1376 family)
VEKPPAFQWYPKDADTDENIRMMDDAEYGFYGRCLNHAWINGGLPGSIEDIARVLQRPVAIARKRWERVGKCFLLVDGRFKNPRQEKDRARVTSFQESRKAAADARWADSKSNAYALRTQCSASASPIATALVCTEVSTEIETYVQNGSISAPGGAGDFALENPVSKQSKPPDRVKIWFEGDFWPVYPRKVAKEPALKAARKAVIGHKPSDIMRGLNAQLPKFETMERDKIPHAATWLNQKRWTDEIESIPAEPPRKLNFEESVEKVMRQRIAEGRPPL